MCDIDNEGEKTPPTEEAMPSINVHIGRHAVDTCSGCMDVLQKDILDQLAFERHRADKAILENIAFRHMIAEANKSAVVSCSLCEKELLAWKGDEGPGKDFVRQNCLNHLDICEQNPQNDMIAELTVEVAKLRAGAWYCEFCDTEQPRDLPAKEAAEHFLKCKGLAEYLTVGPPKKKGKKK